jgi:hypothetical protein
MAIRGFVVLLVFKLEESIMGLFSSSNKLGNNQSQLKRCLETQQDVGVYKWLPEYTWADIVGQTHYQPALKSLLKKYGNTPANVFVMQEVDNKLHPNAIAFYCDGHMIGHVESLASDWWHQLFDYVGDVNTRLVGTVTFSYWDKGKLVMPKPKIQVIRDIRKLVKQSQSPQQ